MTKEDLWGFIKLIQKEYKKDYPSATLSVAYAQLQDIPVACLKSSLDSVMLQHTTLPPMQRIVDATKAEYAKRRREEIEDREHQAAEEKKQYERGLEKAFKSPDGIAQKTTQLVMAMLAGKITRQEYLEGIRHLDNLYPSAGFANEGQKLKAHYETNNLELNAKPRQEAIYE